MTIINSRLTGALAATTAALVGFAGTAVPANAAAAAKPGSAGLGDRLYPGSVTADTTSPTTIFT